MHMQMMQLVPVSPVVELVRPEGPVNRGSRFLHIAHKGRQFLRGQLEQLFYMILVNDIASALICLLLEQEYRRYRKLCHLKHQVIPPLILRTIHTLFILFHVEDIPSGTIMYSSIPSILLL
ncbi:hypothetical protein D3C80_1595870 [compost metagenome]